MAHLLDQLKAARLTDNTVAMMNGLGRLREPLGEKNTKCPEHGPFKSSGTRYMGTREIWTRCPDCDEAMLAAERQAKATEEADRARQRLEAMIEEAAIPARFIGRSFDNFKATTQEQRAALQASQKYADTFSERSKRGDGLIFGGQPGTGKSHLATAIAQAIMPEHQGLYVTCMGMIRAVRNTWRKDSERSESQVLSSLAGVDLLILDEVGVQYGTDGEQNIIFDVLDRRYRELRPTIILTNQSPTGLRDCIGERTYDRLRESSRWVAFDWPSYRPQARQEAA